MERWSWKVGLACVLGALLLGTGAAAEDGDPPPVPVPGGIRRPAVPLHPSARAGQRPPRLHPQGQDEQADQDKREAPEDGQDAGNGVEAGAKAAEGNGGNGAEDRPRPPVVGDDAKVTLDFVDAPLSDVVKFFVEVLGDNIVLPDDIKGSVTIISHKPVSKAVAREVFYSALEVNGYTPVRVGGVLKLVKSGEAGKRPLEVRTGDAIPASDRFVTQVFQLENVPVSDVNKVVTQLAGPNARIVDYAPTNTLIISDSAVNIRRLWKIVSQLDVAAPKSSLRVVQIRYADASDIKEIIEEIYGTEQKSAAAEREPPSRRVRRPSRNRRGRHTQQDQASSTSVGGQERYISKIVADERTNRLIILANDQAMQDILKLIEELDIDVDPASGARIHVVYLEHAKAEDVAKVLSNLSEQASATSRSPNRRTPATRGGRNTTTRRETNQRGGDQASPNSVTALLEDGVKVTFDENTNSLVIVASPSSFALLKGVIDKLDIRRKQVFVEAVIMELASEDNLDLGIAWHGGVPDDNGGLSFGSAQLNASSFGLSLTSADLLSGLAMGVFGEAVDVMVSDGAGGFIDTQVPAFGIALNALQSNSKVNILSTPNILTMDNEEAEIVVGRNIPFPVSSGLDANGNQLVSYQREDVAITLKVTPQINESDFVTLEVYQEVSEVEEDSSGLDVNTAGFITSKRSAETTVVVRDNQTVVIGGLMGQTDTQVETKIPVLGDLPIVGRLFRGRRDTTRKTNLLIFLTPHVISGPEDLEEVYRIKVAQRAEFLRRFYGLSEEEAARELNDLLRYSMNLVDEPSLYRTKIHDQPEEGGLVAPPGLRTPEGDAAPAGDAAPEAGPEEPAP